MSRSRYSPEEQAKYAAYLQSPAWRVKAHNKRVQVGDRCEFLLGPPGGVFIRCRRTALLQVHHRTYERLGEEWDSDLEVLCWFHHLLTHLLWKRCACGEPCLDNDEAGEIWLAATLYTMGIDLDKVTHWNQLPNKERFLVEVPDKCSDCSFGILP